MTIGEQLTAERTKSGLSQKELATKSGLNIDTIRRIENGKNSNPTVVVLRFLSKALNDYKFQI